MALFTVPIKASFNTAGAGEEKTLILIKPEGSALKIRQVDVSLDSAGAAIGVEFDIVRVAYTGGAATVVAAKRMDERDESSLSIASVTWTTEPAFTTKEVLASYYLQPLGGLLPLPFPYGAEIIGKAKGNSVGLRCVVGANTKADLLAQIWFEE